CYIHCRYPQHCDSDEAEAARLVQMDKENRPSPGQVQRSVERPAKGTVFYLISAAFAIASVTIAGLWTTKVLRVRGLEGELTASMERQDYAKAVSVVRELQALAPTLAKDQWRTREPIILTQWAEHELSAGDFANATVQALAARKAGADGLLGDRLTRVLADSALGQLKRDAKQLALQERLARCQTIVTKYAGTSSAKEADALASVYLAAAAQARATFDSTVASVGELKAQGRVREAIDALEVLRGKCEADLVGKVEAMSAELRKLLAQGYYDLSSRQRLRPGPGLAKADLDLLRPGQDLMPLYRADQSYRVSQRREGAVNTNTVPTAFLGQTQGILYCFSATILWAIDQGLGMAFDPVDADDDVVCVSNAGKHLARLSIPSGQVQWCVALPVPVACAPVRVGDEMAVLDQQGHMRIVSPENADVVAEHLAPGSGSGSLLTDGKSRLAVVWRDRAVLFERGEEGWLKTAVILLNADRLDQLYLIGRYALVIPRRPGRGSYGKRLYLWRDRSLTPVNTPPVGDDWRLIDRWNDLQAWIDSRGDLYCTRLDDSKIESPIVRQASPEAFGLRSARFERQRGHDVGLLVAGERIGRYHIDANSKPVALARSWTEEVVLTIGKPQIIDSLAIRSSRQGWAFLAGGGESATVFAAVSMGAERARIGWLIRMGPNCHAVPAVSSELAVWPDGESGVWCVNAAGQVTHMQLSLGTGADGEDVSLITDGKCFLVRRGRSLMLYSAKMTPLWREPAKAPAAIRRMCLLGEFVTVVTDDRQLVTYDRASGRQLLGPVALPPAIDRCVLLRPAAAKKIMLLAANGNALEATIAPGGAGSREWSFRRLWDRPITADKFVSVGRRILAYAGGAWRCVPDNRGPFGAGLPRLLYRGTDTALVAGDDPAEIACVDLKRGAEIWRTKLPSSSLWAKRLTGGGFFVMTLAGHLLTLDSERGQITGRSLLRGTPTGPPAELDGHLWVPANGYRLLKVKLQALEDGDVGQARQ
ncbi:hypothetical protein LCGC14_1659000, partial [marine sediment metagenome]